MGVHEAGQRDAPHSLPYEGYFPLDTPHAKSESQTDIYCPGNMEVLLMSGTLISLSFLVN